MPKNNNVDNVDIRIKVKAPTEAQIQRVNDSADALSRLQKEVSKNSVKSSTTNLKKLIGAEQGASKSTSALAGAMKGLKWTAVLYAGKKAVQTISDWVSYSNDYVENMNLFSVSMGRYAEEAYNYGKQVEQVMGIDLSEWIRGQGVFNQIATGFGIAEDTAYTMSKGLTQLSYDLASFFNLDTEEAMNKVRSGISGELEPLRNLGYALDQATLKQVALDHGITKSITEMTQAEKAQLRYIAIMEQSENAVGDMARTLMSPANAQRVLTAQTDRLKRSLGQLFTPLAMKVVPVLTAITQLTTELVQDMAALVGFELPKIESTDAENNKEAWSEANEELQEYQHTLFGFDQINKMNGIKDTVSNIMGGDLGIDLSVYDYDFLGKANEEVEKIKTKISEFFNMFRNDTTVKAWTDALSSGLELIEELGGTALDSLEPVYNNVLLPIIEKIKPKFEEWGNKINVLLGDIKKSDALPNLKKSIEDASIVLKPLADTLGICVTALGNFSIWVANIAWDDFELKLSALTKGLEGLRLLLEGDEATGGEKLFEGMIDLANSFIVPMNEVLDVFNAIFGTKWKLPTIEMPDRGNIEGADIDNTPYANKDNPFADTGIPIIPDSELEGLSEEERKKMAEAILREAKNNSTYKSDVFHQTDRPSFMDYWNSLMESLGFATGGFPEDGMFFANSRELVGKFTNGKTAVANNEQIVSGIASGVRDANSAQNELLREQNALLRQLIGVTGNARATVTTHDIVEGARRLNRREGTTVIPVG